MKPSWVEVTPPAAAGGVLFLLLDRISFLNTGYWPISVLLTVSFVFCGTWLVTGLSSPKRPPGNPVVLRVVCLFVTGFCLIALSDGVYSRQSLRLATGVPPETVSSAVIRLTEDPMILRRGGWTADARLLETGTEHLKTSARGRVTVFCSGNSAPYGTGVEMTIKGRFKPDTRSGMHIFRIDEVSSFDWKTGGHRFRHHLLGEMERRFSGTGPDGASFLTALLLGRLSDPGSPVYIRFRDSGSMHLLALSGFHISLIALAVRWLLRPLIGFSASTILSGVAAVAYLMVAGLMPSLSRAVVMYLLSIRELLRGRKVPVKCFLSSTFLIQGLLMPGDMQTLAFQLSYAALFGMITAGAAITGLLGRFIPRKLAMVIGAGVGAQLSTLPLVVESFDLWRPAGLIASPVLTIPVTAAMAAGSLRLLFPCGTAAGRGIDFLLEHLVLFISNIAEPFARMPGVVIPGILTWPIAVLGSIMPLALIRRLQYEHSTAAEPRFPGLNPCISGKPGSRPAQKMGPEFPHQQRCPGENSLTSGAGRRPDCLGNRSGVGVNEHRHHQDRRISHCIRNRPGVLRLASGIPRR